VDAIRNALPATLLSRFGSPSADYYLDWLPRLNATDAELAIDGIARLALEQRLALFRLPNRIAEHSAPSAQRAAFFDRLARLLERVPMLALAFGSGALPVLNVTLCATCSRGSCARQDVYSARKRSGEPASRLA